MKNYRLRLQLSVSSSEAGQALGFTFEGDADRYLSVSEAIETICCRYAYIRVYT